MATLKPRHSITFPPNLYQTLSRFAELQGLSLSSVVVGILESIHPPLMRTIALLEAAQEAPESVKAGLRNTVEAMEQDLLRSHGAGMAQLDWLTAQLGSEAPPEREGSPSGEGALSGGESRPSGGRSGGRANPRIVTRGSGSAKSLKNKETAISAKSAKKRAVKGGSRG